MYGQFTMSFAFELTSGQWSRSTESRMSTLRAIPINNFSAILSQIPCGLSSFLEYHFFSEPGPMNDHCPIPNFFASTFVIYHIFLHTMKRVDRLPDILVPKEISLNIDTKRILPVKVSGVSRNLLSRSVTLPQSCNVVNPGKMFHSNSVGSPLIPSKSL